MTSSLAALPSWRAGSLAWKPDLADQAAALRKALTDVDPDAFAAAVRREAEHRLGAFADGVSTFNRASRFRPEPQAQVPWQDGTTRVLDYSVDSATGAPLLVVPSLINRAYILDLSAQRSLMRHLARVGFRPFLVDWGEPGETERDFTLSDYIAGRLDDALAAVYAHCNRPVGVVGHCMGGLLAVALAQRAPDRVGAMALLATPWDFHAMDKGRTRILAAAAPLVGMVTGAMGHLPVDVLQALFTALDPYGTIRKFQGFAGQDLRTRRAREFVAVESWVSDGVPLTGPVARSCLGEWYLDNATARGTWRIDGRVVQPADIECPVLCVVPGRDHIVPRASALPLVDALPRGEALTLDAGHVGMVVGRRAVEQLYKPLAAWLGANLG